VEPTVKYQPDGALTLTWATEDSGRWAVWLGRSPPKE